MKVTQISCFIENRPGRLHAACEALANKGINIHTLSLADTTEFGILRLIVGDPAAGKAALEEAGYIAKLTEVVAVEVNDEAGGLANILAKADAANLNIEYMYAFTEKRDDNAVMIFRFDDIEEAKKVLIAEGFNLVKKIDIIGE